jgi:hypothetical protein
MYVHESNGVDDADDAECRADMMATSILITQLTSHSGPVVTARLLKVLLHFHPIR